MHVLTARIRPIDAICVRRGVPVVDCRVELHSRVSALPCCLCELAKQCAGLHSSHDRSICSSNEIPISIIQDRLHELIAYTNRVVCILVLNRGDVTAIKTHVESCICECSGLLLFVGLAPDEVLDVRVIDVEHDHLGRTTSLSPRLDRSCRCISTTHEAHWSRRGTTTV